MAKGVRFGGLVPQASGILVDTVSFTVSGKLDRTSNELEILIDELYTQCEECELTNIEIFGLLVCNR
jgi:hypothetical protein